MTAARPRRRPRPDRPTPPSAGPDRPDPPGDRHRDPVAPPRVRDRDRGQPRDRSLRMEDWRVVGLNEDTGKKNGPGRPPGVGVAVVALEDEAGGRETDPDGLSREDGPKAGLMKTRRHLPDPRPEIEPRPGPPDRGGAAVREKAGDGQDDEDLDQGESPAPALQLSTPSNSGL